MSKDMKVVKKGAHLHWPATVANAENRYRGGEGYFVDLSAPLEDVWCAGQLHKLEDAPTTAKASPLTLPNALGQRKLALDKATATPGPTVDEKASAAGVMDPVPVDGDTGGESADSEPADDAKQEGDEPS